MDELEGLLEAAEELRRNEVLNDRAKWKPEIRLDEDETEYQDALPGEGPMTEHGDTEKLLRHFSAFSMDDTMHAWLVKSCGGSVKGRVSKVLRQIVGFAMKAYPTGFPAELVKYVPPGQREGVSEEEKAFSRAVRRMKDIQSRSRGEAV